MVTILREGGWSIIIYKDDHPPAHVHVIGHGGSMKIDLAAPGDEPALLKSVGVTTRDIRRALAIVARHQDILLARWNEFHGSI